MSLEWVKVNAVKLHEAVGDNAGDDVKRAMLLLTYCAKVENGGVITGCGGWDRGKWQRDIGCYPPKDRRDAEGLWYWQGDNLVVSLYNVEAEKRVQELRARGKQGRSMRASRGVSKGDDRGRAHNVKHSEQNKTAKAYAKADANTDKIREEQKEINKEKGGEEDLKDAFSPGMPEYFCGLHEIALSTRPE